MKHSKLIIFAYIVLQTTLIFSQETSFNCDFTPPPSYFNTSIYSGMAQRNTTNDETYIFNVKFHLIAENGESAHDITEEELLRCISVMNINFNEFNIFYKYRGFDMLESADAESGTNYIDNVPYDLNIVKNDFIEAGLYQENMINIYILNNTGNSGTYWGQIYINNFTDYTEDMITHELGHELGLLHVFSGDFSPISQPLVHPCSGFQWSFFHEPVYLSDIEHITRDVNDSNYNATTIVIDGIEYPGKGDMIHDTEACFRFYRTNMCGIEGEFVEDYRVHDNSDNPNTTCFYCAETQLEYCYTVGNNFYEITDSDNISTNITLNSNTWQDIIDNNLINCNQIEFGIMYRGLETINHNYMSYGRSLNYFTAGQVVRMKETIDSDPELQQRLAKLSDGTTDFSVLYEPYTGEYFGTGTTLPSHRTLFQPGFNYTFVQCGGTQQNYGIQIYNSPSDYNDISFIFTNNTHAYGFKIDKYSLDFNNITHPNHTAIFIKQLNVNNLNNGGQPRKCYNNFNRNSIGGTVIKFEDNILNTNVTIDQKNEQEINNNNLIQNLQQGLYKIEKNYDDGSKIQKTIYKDGN